MDAGTRESSVLLRMARSQAGLSQTQLSRRVGVPQSMISMYETGARQPALSTLVALVAATGFDLDLRLRRRSLDRLTGPIGQRVRRHRSELLRIARLHGVYIHGVFGSVARGTDRSDSDLDLLVDLPSDIGLLGIARIEAKLEQVVDARVELIPAADLKPGVRPGVLSDLVPL
ncbi:MAG: helix-turn-helix domain-containing protein [Actinomycetota bacterium]|nr:helix-turn-helix domain-containing protein [Actinomycetota bacterium]